MKNFKRILATVLAVLFVASMMVVGVSAASSDKAWYKAAVEYLDGLTISNIGSTGDELVSRDEFVTWVAKIESHQLIESAWKKQEFTALSTFDDVSDSEHKGAIGYSVGREFIKGNGDGTFTPHEAVKFGEAAAVIVRLMAFEDLVKGETWNEQVENYLFVANTYCGAFDATFLAKTAQYDADRKLTKGEAAYILYTIMNGKAWADDELSAEELANLNLTAYGVDLGEFFANNNSATVKAAFVVANVPLVYTNTTQTFRRYDTYMSGATYDLLYTQKLYSSSGVLDTGAGKNVTLQNLTTGTYVTIASSTFSSLVKKAAGHGDSDDKTQALNYVEYGGVVTIAVAKANKDRLDDAVNPLTAGIISKFTINDYLAADGFVGEKADTLANLNKGTATVGWKTLGAAAAASGTYTRLTTTPAGWTNVKYNASGVPTSGSLVVNGETYSVVTAYTGKANEIKVYAPSEIFDDNGKLVTKKNIVISAGQIGDTIYAGGVFDDNQKAILNLHRHVVATDITAGKTYYTRSGEGTAESPFVYTQVNLNEDTYDEDETYYVTTDAGYRAAEDADFTFTVTGYTVAAATGTYDATKTYYVADAVAANTYNPATRDDFDVSFTTGKTYYVYDAQNDKYIVNTAAYDADTVYYLQVANTNETITAGLNDFTVAFTANKTYYVATPATEVTANTTYYEKNEQTGVLTEAAAAVTKSWTTGVTYYTEDAGVYTAVDTTNVAAPDANTAYYIAITETAYALATADDFSTYFTSGKNYYTAAAADTTAAVDANKIGTTYYVQDGATLKLAKASDFTIGFKAGTTYYTYDSATNTYPVAAAYDATKTYYVEATEQSVTPTVGAGVELALATLADFQIDWVGTTTYYEVTKVNTSTTAYVANTVYYVDGAVADTIVPALVNDFTVFFKLQFHDGQEYYEYVPLTGRFGPTADTEVDITKTYYVKSNYDEFFNGNTVKTSFQLTETIPSFVSYIYSPEGGAFVTNQNFNTYSSFVVDGYLDTLTIDTENPLTVAEALQLILGPAQGESNVVFSDTDGDGAYDIAVVTESNRALYYKDVNDSHDPANGGDLASDDAYTREVYDSFGNFIMTVEGLKSHNIGGIAVGYKVGNGGTTGTGSDGWYVTTTATNKVTVVVTANNERQFRTGGGDTHQYGLSNLYPYTPTGVDVADLTTGYIENVAAGTSKVGGVTVYTASVITADGERTTVYIPVDPAEKIRIPVTLDGVTSDVTFASGRSLLSFVTDHVVSDEIGTVQTGSWMAGHTVKYVTYENGVAWCMVDTAVQDAVTGYVTAVTKTDTGDNTYKVTVVATGDERSYNTNAKVDYEYVAANIKNGASMAAVITSFGIDALFEDIQVKVARVTGDLSNWSWKMDAKGADGQEAIALGAGTYGVQMTGLYYGANGADGATVPEWKQSGNQFRYDDSAATKNQKFEQGTYIAYADYQYIIKPQYQQYFTVETISSQLLFGFLKEANFDTLGYYNTAYGNATAASITVATTTEKIGVKVQTLEVKASATAVWTYDAATYALVNNLLVKGTLYDSDYVWDNQVVSQYDLIYLTFTKDAGSYYTIGGMDNDAYETVESGEGTAFFRANYAVFTKGGNRGGWRGDTYFGLAKQLYTTGAGSDTMWTNFSDTANGDFVWNNAYILGYTKKANTKVDLPEGNGYYDLYDMTVGYNPYYVRHIDGNGKITYTLMFMKVEKLQNVKGYFYYPVDPNNTLLIALINQATMKQEIDDGVSYKDTSEYYVDPTTNLVYLIYGEAQFDKTKTTAQTPDYVTAGATVVEGSQAYGIAASAIKAQFGLTADVKEENLATISAVAYTEDEAGYVPGLYHVYLTDGLGHVKSFQMTQNSKIVVIYPDSTTGNFTITTTTAKDLVAAKATVFATDYQYDGSTTTCTMLSVIGKINKPVAPVTVDTNDTVTPGTKFVYLNGDATVIAEAIQLNNYWVIRSTESAIDITTGEEVGSIQFVFTTYLESERTSVEKALKAGGYFLINKDNEVISVVPEAAGIYGTNTQSAQVLTGVITGVTADGKTTATIKGVEGTDISKYTFKFIYHDTEGANFGIGGKNTSVAILTTSEIEATWAADEAIVAEGANAEPHFYTKEDVATAAEGVANTKAAAIDAYLNGTFWNVEFSPLYNYFVSQRISYQNRKDITLTFNYVVIDNVYYVFVNSFTK